MTKVKLNIAEKTKGSGNCKERDANYTARCSKYKVAYIGHAGKKLPQCLSKHRYNIKNRSDISELLNMQDNHDINDNPNVIILQNNIKNAAAQRYQEGKWICRLKTLAWLKY